MAPGLCTVTVSASLGCSVAILTAMSSFSARPAVISARCGFIYLADGDISILQLSLYYRCSGAQYTFPFRSRRLLRQISTSRISSGIALDSFVDFLYIFFGKIIFYRVFFTIFTTRNVFIGHESYSHN